MRNPGPIYNLNDPVMQMDAIIDRLVSPDFATRQGHAEFARERIQGDTILIYLGDIPDDRQNTVTSRATPPGPGPS